MLQLLEKDVGRRLQSAADMEKLPFFEHINFDAVLMQQVKCYLLQNNLKIVLVLSKNVCSCSNWQPVGCRLLYAEHNLCLVCFTFIRCFYLYLVCYV
jgi:hypothetical protein